MKFCDFYHLLEYVSFSALKQEFLLFSICRHMMASPSSDQIEEVVTTPEDESGPQILFEEDEPSAEDSVHLIEDMQEDSVHLIEDMQCPEDSVHLIEAMQCPEDFENLQDQLVGEETQSHHGNILSLL